MKDGRKASKFCSRGEDSDTLPDHFSTWNSEMKQSGYPGQLEPYKVETEARYILTWREPENRSIKKSFPPTPEGLQQAIATRDAIDKHIGNTDGQRL